MFFKIVKNFFLFTLSITIIEKNMANIIKINYIILWEDKGKCITKVRI